MGSFIHLAGDSWSMWSPFPPAVTFWLIDVIDQLWGVGLLG
ncbi:hypothetical protein P3H15_45785 [Rhodococcus sp. T2V]|nr:hypothetical protein [Rhodococcus sp. T2V]MDF3312270.1 hypothetical protein [Rhodococcus sp. T2V]